MGCSRKKKWKQPKQGRYICTTCGQVRKDKKKLCEPTKLKR